MTLAHWIVMKCLEKDPNRRYESAAALAADLQRYLDHEPVLARPPSRAYRFGKFVRRHRGFFAAGLAVTLALLAGTIVSSWQAYRAILAEHEQARLRDLAEQARAAEADLRATAQARALAARRRAYAADMNLLHQALEANNLGRARRLLDAQRPAPGQEDLRGWEWRYLWQLCRSDAEFTLCQHSNEVHSLTASADGRFLAVAEADGGISIWDWRQRQAVFTRPTAVGRTLVAAAPAGAAFAFTERPRDESFRSPWRLRVWQADPQPDVAEIRLPAPCLALSFSPDGRHLVTLTADGRVASHRVPEGDTAELARIPLARGEGRVAALSADLRWLAYSRNGGRIAVADLTTGAELWSAEAAQEQLTSVAFAPDGSRLATGAGFTESTIRLWDVSSGQELARLEGHRTWVGALAFSADGTTLASASADQTIGLWDLANLSERSASEAVHGLTQVVHPKRILRGHQLEVWSLAWLRDGRRLASGAKDGTVLIWEPDRPLASPASQLVPGEFAAWSFEGDRPQLLTLERDGTVGRWTGEGLRQFTPLGHGLTNLFFPRFSGSGRFLVGSIAGGAIRVWSVAQQTAAREFRVAEGPLTPVAFLPGSDRLIARRWPQPEFQEWDCNTGQRLRTWRLAASPRLLAVRTVAVNGEWLAALNDDGTGQLLHLPTGRATDLRLDLKQITAATLSADGTLLAAVSRFGVGGLWEIPSAAPVATYSGVLQALVSATFSPDGRRLALGSDGAEAIKLWDLAGHQELLTLSAEGSGFATAAFSADGSLLAASNRDGRLRVWRAPTWDQIGRAESTAAQ